MPSVIRRQRAPARVRKVRPSPWRLIRLQRLAWTSCVSFYFRNDFVRNGDLVHRRPYPLIPSRRRTSPLIRGITSWNGEGWRLACLQRAGQIRQGSGRSLSAWGPRIAVRAACFVRLSGFLRERKGGPGSSPAKGAVRHRNDLALHGYPTSFEKMPELARSCPRIWVLDK